MQRNPLFNQVARICVVGVGGGGGNAINRMILDGIRGVDFIAINTEANALTHSEANTQIHIGRDGRGAGGDARKGRIAAALSKADIRRALHGADLVFVVAGMGGGTGTGAAPVVAQVARELNALTIGVVTHPFTFEGGRRVQLAKKGIEELQEEVDSLIAIPNDKLLGTDQSRCSLQVAFRQSDDVLKQAIQGITEIITCPGTINLDFADLTAVMKEGGRAVMSIITAEGAGGAMEAVETALDGAMLGVSADGAKGVLYNIKASSKMMAEELFESAELIKARIDPNANFMFGLINDETMGDNVQITLIAAGVDSKYEMLMSPVPLPRSAQAKVPPMRNVPDSPPPMRARRLKLGFTPKQPENRFSAEKWGLPSYLQTQPLGAISE